MVHHIAGHDVPNQMSRTPDEHRNVITHDLAYLTGPISFSVDFVSSVRGVDARTQTSPLESLIAVERPPNRKKPIRVNGLHT